MAKLTRLALSALVLASVADAQVEARITIAGTATGKSNSAQATFAWVRVNDTVVSVPLSQGLTAPDASSAIEKALLTKSFVLVRENATVLRVTATPSPNPPKRVPVTNGATVATNDPGMRVGTNVILVPSSTPNTKRTGAGFALADATKRCTSTTQVKIAVTRETKIGPEQTILVVGVTVSENGASVNKKIVDVLQANGFVVNQVVWPSLVDGKEIGCVNVDRTTKGTGVIECAMSTDLHQLGILEATEVTAATKALFGFTDYGNGVGTSTFSNPAWIEGVGFPKPGADLVTISHMVAGSRPCVRLLGAGPAGLVLPGLPPVLVNLTGVILLPFVSAPLTGDFEMRFKTPAVATLTGVSLFLQDIRIDPQFELGSSQGIAVTLGRL